MPALGVDLGTVRIGLAISDPSETFALPLTVLERGNIRQDIERIVEIANERSCDTIVIGDPLTLRGERGAAAGAGDRFAERLTRRFRGKVERSDERLTTAQATKTLIAADVSRTRRKRVVDKLAAALILDSYLARRAKAR